MPWSVREVRAQAWVPVLALLPWLVSHQVSWTALVGFFVTEIKCHAQKKLDEERIYVVYRLQSITMGSPGTQSRCWEVGTEAETIEEGMLLAGLLPIVVVCSACLLKQSRATCLGWEHRPQDMPIDQSDRGSPSTDTPSKQHVQ